MPGNAFGVPKKMEMKNTTVQASTFGKRQVSHLVLEKPMTTVSLEPTRIHLEINYCLFSKRRIPSIKLYATPSLQCQCFLGFMSWHLAPWVVTQNPWCSQKVHRVLTEWSIFERPNHLKSCEPLIGVFQNEGVQKFTGYVDTNNSPQGLQLWSLTHHVFSWRMSRGQEDPADTLVKHGQVVRNEAKHGETHVKTIYSSYSIFKKVYIYMYI